MAISEQDLLRRDVLKNHIDAVNQRKLDMGPPSPRGNDYTRPVDEHVARGYFDETNQITPLGEEFLTLHDNGLVDDFGSATELGQSYLMSNREALDAPVSVYRFREESGLAEAERFAASKDGEQRGFTDMIYDFATKSIPSAVETGYNIAIAPVAETALSVPRKIVELATGVDYKLPRTMSPNDITNAVAENMTGSILASEDIAAGAIYAGTMAIDDPATFGANILDKLPYGLVVRKVAGDPVMDEMVRRKTDESFAAKQAFERSRSEIDELTGAQMMETVAPIFQWAKAREQLVAENGEEAVKSKEENDRLLGSIALDPENVLSLGAGIAIKGATTAVAKTNLWAARTSLKNAALQAERAAVQSEMSAIQAGLTRPARWISDAELKSKALVDVGDFQGATRYDEFIKRVNLKSEVPLQRVSELSATEAKLGDEITQLGKSPDIANAILASKEKAANFRNLTAGGFGLAGAVGDKIGSAMVKADDFLDAASKNMGIDSAVSALKSLPAAIGGYVMGGVPAGVTAALNVLARGKVVQSMGNFSKVLGSELMQERGSIGYWGRVAQNSTLTKTQRFLAHRADELTLGGSLMDVARPVVKGTVAAYPMNLAFEAVSNPDASGQEMLTNAAGPALVFGGGSAGAGAVLQGRQANLAQIRMADEYNFTRRMAGDSTEGSQAFSSLVPSARRVVSTLAATYPNLNWDFSSKTESFYDPVSNTINVNPESNNPLRPLVSHEVLHYVTIRNQMEPVVHSTLLGDSETPGLIRNTDGTLDPEFKAFKDVYDARIANANLEPRTIEQVAEEYFNEATVDELLSMVDTGEVSRIAGRTQLGRKVKALIDATIPKITILKDLFTHTGGVRGMDGKPVMGNGLLADGIRDLPEAKAIMRKLIRDSAGQDPTRATSGDRSGTRIEIKRGDSVIDSFHSIFEVDASGNPIRDKNGDPVRLSRATDEARKSAGLVIGEAQRNKVSNGYLPKEGEMKQQANGSWQGRYIDKSLIDVLAGRGILNPKQIAILRNLSTATKGNQGLRFLLTNHPATIRNRKGKLNYATLEATLRESVPVGFSITKDGNILVHNMSVGQLDANITARAGSKRGIDLYSGNTESIKRDVSEMMERHQKNTATDEFYQNKYGSRWKEYQQFINTVFGLMTKEQQLVNPMFQSDSISSQKGQVYRTYRLDRISKATHMDGATSMPFHYENIKMNFLPDGFADTTKPADTTRYLPDGKDEDGFYSQLDRVIVSKVPNRSTSQQIVNSLGEYIVTKTEKIDGKDKTTVVGKFSYTEQSKAKSLAASVEKGRFDWSSSNKIREEEIKWSGIEQALASLKKDGKVSKEDLLNYLRNEGNVRFEEVTLSDINTQKEMRLRRFRESQQKFRENGIYIDVSSTGEVLLRDKYSGPPNIDPNSLQGDLKKEFEILSDNASDDRVSERSEPLFSDRVLPGGENYREVVLTMPPKNGHRYDKMDLVSIRNDLSDRLKKAKISLDTTSGRSGVEYGNINIREWGGDKYLTSKNIGDQGLRSDFDEFVRRAKSNQKAPMDDRGKIGNSAYTSSHFPNIPNYVAHMRLDERTLPDGTRTLHSAEYQSDRHQEGRKRGYKGDNSVDLSDWRAIEMNGRWRVYAPGDLYGRLFDGNSSAEAIQRANSAETGEVADAPFRTTWPLQLFKRQLRDAVEGGFDSVSWDVGETQRDRYDLSEQIEKIDVQTAPNGDKEISLMPKGDASAIMIETNKDGKIFNSSENFVGKSLEDVIGKELANKVLQTKNDELSGSNLKVGGEGMRGFYDTMLPKEIGKYVKQWNAKVEKSEIGQSMSKDEIDMYDLEDATPEELAQLKAEGMVKGDAVPIWSVKITPEMRKITETGQTRYLPEAADADYMKAVKSGDVETQQRMVDAAIPEKFSTEGWHVTGGTSATFSAKDRKAILTVNDATHFFSEEWAAKKYAKKNGGEVLKFMLDLQNPKRMKDIGSGWIDALDGLPDSRDGIVYQNDHEGGGDSYVIQYDFQAIRSDLVVRDDSGNVIPLSQRFNPTTSDIRYLPDGLPKNYQSNRDEGYLRASIGKDGLMNIDRPFKSTEALPTVSMRHDYPVEDFKVFNFDKKASVVYAKNKNGVNISFKFDPSLMNQPEFADFDTKYKGMVVQLAMADRHGATDGDMGGHSFPDLKVNQDNIVTDENGKEYKIVWANNAWGPVANMSSKAQKFGAVTLLTYNMDLHAHDSNTRTVRIFSNEIANSGLSVKDQSTILIVQNVALKKFLTSASKADLRALLKVQRKLINNLKIDDKIASGSKKYPEVERLSAADREALLYEINDGELQIEDQKALLKEALGAKDATVEEMKVDKLFRDYQTKRRASEKTPKSEVKAKAMRDAEKAVRDFQKTKEFKLAEKLLPSRELDQFSNTFNGRKSLIKAIKTSTAAVKWGSFDALRISEKIGDQMTGDSMSIVSSVELSSDPNFKAVYLGENPKEIARMTPSEKLAADKLKSNPNFVSHEAYQWAMLGPAESKHYFNTNQRSVLDSFPSFLDEYSKLPVKGKKLKLNDPMSKASEFNKVNTIRDQSKIKIVYGGTDKKQQ